MEEQWRPVKGYEGHYEVSNLGRVKSLLRFKDNNKGKQIVESKIKDQTFTAGYPSLNIYLGGDVKRVYTHRLVADAFIPNPDNKKTVNHKNGIKTDNKVNNLEWATYSENTQHAIETGLAKQGNPPKGSTNGFSKLTEDKVIRMRLLYEKGNISMREVAELFGIAKSTVVGIMNRKSWNHV